MSSVLESWLATLIGRPVDGVGVSASTTTGCFLPGLAGVLIFFTGREPFADGTSLRAGAGLCFCAGILSLLCALPARAVGLLAIALAAAVRLGTGAVAGTGGMEEDSSLGGLRVVEAVLGRRFGLLADCVTVTFA